MKANTHTALQVIAIFFILVVGVMSYASSSNWDIIKVELDKTRNELENSKSELVNTKNELTNSLKEIEELNIEKNILTAQRDSFLLDFERKNAKDWNDLKRIEALIEANNKKLVNNKAFHDKIAQ